MKVAFATLYLGDKPTEPFIRSLENCLPLVEQYGWDHCVVVEKDCPYISAARLEVTKKALKADADVIVYLDYDVSWTPESMVKLLETEGDVVAGTYRTKRNDCKYMGVLDVNSTGELIVRKDGCIRANKVPAGFLKLTRNCLERFARAYPNLLIGSVLAPALDLFNHGAIDGTWYGEDYAFSKRWCDCGGEIWVIPDLDIDHHRNGECFKGNLHKYLLNYNKPKPILDEPLVSVIIPNYNYAQYIQEAIDSVRCQTYKNIELIVIDDGSTDNSVEVINKNSDLTLIQQENKGVSIARNIAAERAAGEWLVFLDSDDIILPTFIEECLKVPDADVIATYRRDFGDNDKVYPVKDNPTYYDFMSSNQISVTSLIRKTVFDAVAGFDAEFNGLYDDWELWLRVAKEGYVFKSVPKALFKYRKHGRSLVTAAHEKDFELRQKMAHKHGFTI